MKKSAHLLILCCLYAITLYPQQSGSYATAFQKTKKGQQKHNNKSSKNKASKTYQLPTAESLFKRGKADFKAKRWQSAYHNLKKSLQLYDEAAAANNQSPITDTALLLPLGAAADKLNKKTEAGSIYTRIADAKIAGNGLEDVYYYVISQAFIRKDYESFDKYLALGAEVFPDSYYFKFSKVNFVMGHMVDFTKRLEALEDIQAKQPTDYQVNMTIAKLISDSLIRELNAGKISPAPAIMEEKMTKAFHQALEGKPANTEIYLHLANYYTLKADFLKAEKVQNDSLLCVSLETVRKNLLNAFVILALKTPEKDYYHRNEDINKAKAACLDLIDIYGGLAELKSVDKNQVAKMQQAISVLSNIWNKIKYIKV